MASPLRIQLILCDAAVSDPTGKIHMLGAGWGTCPTPTPPHAVAALIKVPWDRTNQQLSLKFRLVDADGHPVTIETPEGASEVQAAGQLEVGRPPGVTPGTELGLSFCVNVPSLPLARGRYEWQAEADGVPAVESFEVR